MELMIWLEQLPDNVLRIATLAVIFVILIAQLIVIAIVGRPEHKEKHISGFTNRKAKKGELKK